MPSNRDQHLRSSQATRYAGVGILSTVAYLSIFFLLREQLGIYAANILAMAVSTIGSTIAHALFTFGPKSGLRMRQAAKVGTRLHHRRFAHDRRTRVGERRRNLQHNKSGLCHLHWDRRISLRSPNPAPVIGLPDTHPERSRRGTHGGDLRLSQVPSLGLRTIVNPRIPNGRRIGSQEQRFENRQWQRCVNPWSGRSQGSPVLLVRSPPNGRSEFGSVSSEPKRPGRLLSRGIGQPRP